MDAQAIAHNLTNIEPLADLQGEFSSMACAWADQALINAGCTFRSIIRCGYVAETQAFVSGEYFTPHAFGDRKMIVLPVYDGSIPYPSDDFEDDEFIPADLIAWEPANPKRWYFRLKADPKPILGRSLISAAKISQQSPTKYDAPLEVFSNPQEWIRGGGEGVCLLTRSAMRDLLGLKNIYCADRTFAVKLDAELRKPNPLIPTINVPRGN